MQKTGFLWENRHAHQFCVWEPRGIYFAAYYIILHDKSNSWKVRKINHAWHNLQAMVITFMAKDSLNTIKLMIKGAIPISEFGG